MGAQHVGVYGGCTHGDGCAPVAILLVAILLIAIWLILLMAILLILLIAILSNLLDMEHIFETKASLPNKTRGNNSKRGPTPPLTMTYV